MVGIAILGAGIFAKEAHLPALATIAKGQPNAFELKAVYSRSEKSSISLAAAAKETLGLSTPPKAYFDVAEGGGAADAQTALDALLARDDVQGVIVVLPITMQPDVVRRALAAGKHVISEKPVAPDVKEGAKLILTYRSEYAPKGLIWRVAENFEAEEAFRTAAQWVKEGKIGAVQQFQIRLFGFVDENSKYYKTPWRTKPDYQGGFLLDGGVHFVAAMRIMLGEPLTSLSAHASLAKSILAPHDTITATAQSASGAHGTVHLSFGAPDSDTGAALGGNLWALVGAEGHITVISTTVDGKPVNRAMLKRVPKKANGERGTPEEKSEDYAGRGVELELASWLGALVGKDDGLGFGDPKNALQDVAFIEAALTSEGRIVDLAKLAATADIA